MDIVIATNNIDKIKEYNEILSPLGFNCLSLKDLNIVCDPEETGLSFQENALIKAKEIAKFTNKVVLAVAKHRLGHTQFQRKSVPHFQANEHIL